MPSVSRAAPGFRRTTNPNPPSKPASPRPRNPATPAPIASSPAAANVSQYPAAKSSPESNAGSIVTEQITPSQPEDPASASVVPINTQINARAKSIRRARSHRAQAARSARNEPAFARRAIDSRRHARRDRASRAERDSQPRGCPKGEDPVRRNPRQRGGLKRLGMAAGHGNREARRTLPRYQTCTLSHAGCGACSYESGVGWASKRKSHPPKLSRSSEASTLKTETVSSSPERSLPSGQSALELGFAFSSPEGSAAAFFASVTRTCGCGASGSSSSHS